MGDKNVGVKTRRQLTGVEHALLSIVEPNKFTEASKSDEWVKSMNEELDQIEKNETWELVSRLEDKNIVGTKWIFKNKFDRDGQVIRNKERLVCKGLLIFCFCFFVFLIIDIIILNFHMLN